MSNERRINDSAHDGELRLGMSVYRYRIYWRIVDCVNKRKRVDMITTKAELYAISDMYKELKSFGHTLGCRDMADGVCGCEVDNVLVRVRRIIEKSAVELGLTQTARRMMKRGSFQKRNISAIVGKVTRLRIS